VFELGSIPTVQEVFTYFERRLFSNTALPPRNARDDIVDRAGVALSIVEDHTLQIVMLLVAAFDLVFTPQILRRSARDV